MEQTIGSIAIILSILLQIDIGISTDISDKAFGKHPEGVLAAFGDFNSDELTDAFVLKNQSSLQIYAGFDKEPLLRPSIFICDFSDSIITSVVPGDYDGDAFMDVLITTVPKNNQNILLQQIRILWGGEPYFNCSNATVKLETLGQPLVIDYDQDMTLDLFGINKRKQRAFWIFNHDRSPPTEILMDDDFILKLPKIPHSHAFIDINGDNLADLLITTEFEVEIWSGNQSPGFTYEKSIPMLIGPDSPIFGQALFLDVSLTGQFSMILPVCFDADCRNSTLLIYEDGEEGNWRDLLVNFNDGHGETWRLVPPRNETYLDTMTMRSGDFNMDGYPDIILTLCKEKSSETYVFLLHNIACDFKECQFKRTYQVQWDKFTQLGNGIVLATFYDFYMNGVLDVIYMRKNSTAGTYTMHGFKNEIDYDVNFIKVTVLTGLTNKRSPEIYGPFHKEKWTYGTNLPGPKISYSTVSHQGNQRTGVCAQLPQSAYFSLQLPYSIFGLDRTPNFVENLMVGLSGHLRTWTQIIPNSQVVLIPKPPSDPSQWKAQLFVRPSKLILNSILVLTAILAIIILTISYIHWQERNDIDDLVFTTENRYSKL